MEVVSKNVHWLLPEEACPCDIFLYFRGQYATAIPAGQTVTFKLLEKLAKAQCTHVYIRASDQPAWQEWSTLRCPKPRPAPSTAAADESEARSLYGNKRAELLSYVQKSAVKKTEEDRALNEAFPLALAVLRKVINLPTLDWYFQKFHEPPELFHHCGRVAYAMAIFLHVRRVATDAEVEAAVFAALIHELEGSIADNMKTVVSQQTIESIEKNRHVVAREVIQQLELHDELCSGKGFPNNRKRNEIPIVVRVFTLFNHFDAYRARNTGTRRSRFEKTKETMTARQADYDPAIWPLFWDFWERLVEGVT